MSENRVTIHITSRERSSELACLLHSLRAQTFKKFDILILDNQYTSPIVSNFKFIHDILSRLKLEGHGVEILRDNVSHGVCKARQRLIDDDPWKENPYVLRLDDDQVLEPDYLQRLVQVMEDFPQAGIVSGVTPTFSGPDAKRSVESVKPIVNKLTLNEQGDVIGYNDDCGVLYDKPEVLPAHNFRSSALLKREMFDKGLGYEKGLSLVGFREEFFLSNRTLLLGYKIFVDLGAVAWHAHCASGGCRYPDYAQKVQMDNEKAMGWVKEHSKKLKEVL